MTNLYILKADWNAPESRPIAACRRCEKFYLQPTYIVKLFLADVGGECLYCRMEREYVARERQPDLVGLPLFEGMT